MSRRPNPAADRTEQNRQTLKTLVKLEGNKSCADCKRNKHPRWASWNLGIFVCIRCSGIHRGMGTHISRVKSVDLDSWTDEQLASMIKWGNARANKYWEAKLAPAHVPSENKIENFIRTKYESKRWVMDGPMPDPSTLDVEDDDVPLKKVQEKVQIERSASQRLASTAGQPPRARQQQTTIDLFGDDTTPQRPSTGPPVGRLPPKAEPAPPKTTKAGDSLLGLDFMGGAPSAQPARPSSTGTGTGTGTGTSAASAPPSRPDLKQSILSLYASAPKPAPQPQAQQHARPESFGGYTSPPQSQQTQQQSGFGGLNDAFGSLSFNSGPTPQQPKPSPFSGLDMYSSKRSPPPTTSSSSNMFGGGGGFFNAAPGNRAPPGQAQQIRSASKSGFDAFSGFGSPSPTTTSHKPALSSGLNDLLDFSMTAASPPVPNRQPLASPSSNIDSAFNLSAPAPKPAPAAAPAPSYSSNFGGGMDAWGSNDVWGSSAPSQPAAPVTIRHTQHAQAPAQAPKSPGWGAASSPHVMQDDDFGGWSSAAPTSGTTATSNANSNNNNNNNKGFSGGGDDLFSNVWE